MTSVGAAPHPATDDQEPTSEAVRGLNGDRRPLDIEAFIDARGLSPFQWFVAVLCFLVIGADGFDTVAIGYVGPALAKAWGLPRQALGPLFSSALVGTAVGALFAGPFGDRYGRKRVLVSSVLLFGAMTLVGAATSNLAELMTSRILAGLGLGAAMPNAVTLVSEFSPARHRALIVNAMFTGFTLGSSGGGFASAWLIADHGWRVIFLIGGLIPLALAIVLVWMPESLRFLATTDPRHGRIGRTLERLDPSVVVTAPAYAVNTRDMARDGAPVALLLSRAYRAGSFLLWCGYFMPLIVYFGLTNWLPTLMGEMGHSLKDASIVTALLSVGAGAGPLAFGWLMERLEPNRVVAAGFALAGLCVWCVTAAIGTVLLPWFLLVTGAFLSGSINSMPVLAATFYPTRGRASGVAWMLGVGRFGGIVGAAGIGLLLSLGMRASAVLAVLAAPAFVAGAALLAKSFVRAPGATSLDEGFGNVRR